MNSWNYTNFESDLATMVIYLPVKFEFDWTKHFRVRVRKRKCRWTDGQTDVKHINLIGGLVTCNPPKKSLPSGSFMSLTYTLNVYLKPWFLAHEKKNILIYYQMRFQLCQVHIMTVIGLKSGKKSINWGSMGI